MLTVLAVGAVFYALGWATRPAKAEVEPDMTPAGPGYTEPLPSHGPADAKVVIIEVADYKCRFCAIRNGLVKRLLAEHRDARFVFKHFPFVSAAESEAGAIATMAANRQGKFFEYSDHLFRHRAEPWDKDALVGYATTLGLDVAKFEQDLGDPQLKQYVRKDKAAAETLRVRATPTLLINGKVVPNDAKADEIRMMVRDAKAQVDGLLERGEAATVLEARAMASARNHPLGSTFARIYIDNDVSDL